MLVRLPYLPLAHSHTARVCILPPCPLSVLHLALNKVAGAQVDFLQSSPEKDSEEDLDGIWADSRTWEDGYRLGSNASRQ